MSSSLIKGTAILTIGLFLSKLLGVIYVIPFYSLVGEDNVGLYQYAYVPYNLMLSLAISGMPIAFSKFVSKYNTLGDYQTGRELLKSGLKIMTVTGVVSFFILFFLAEPIARVSIQPDDKLFTIQDITESIRWVSFALLAVPILSLTRGFFQGYSFMMPTAVSQLIEQIVRIAFILLGSFAIIHWFGGSQKFAVQFSVFTAFLGALGGLIVLYYYWRKKKPEYDLLRDEATVHYNIGLKDVYKEVIVYAIPVVFLGIANPLFQFVDLLTFNRAMASTEHAAQSSTYLTMLNFLTQKLVMIPVMLATGFSMALVPYITKYFTLDNFKALHRSLDQTYQVILFLTLPAVVGMMLLSPDLYHVFYEKSEMGAFVLMIYLPAAIFFSFFPVTASILQGINQQKWIILNLLIGLLLKFVLNIPLISLFETAGAVAATLIGYGVSIGLNMWIIGRTLNYSHRFVIRRSIFIVLMNAGMVIVAGVALWLLNFVLPPSAKWISIIRLFIVGGVGAVVYLYAGLRTGLAQKLLGERLTKYTKRFGFE